MAAPTHQPPITMREAERMLRRICSDLDRLTNSSNLRRKGVFESDLAMARHHAYQARGRLSDRIHAQLRDTNEDKDLNRC